MRNERTARLTTSPRRGAACRSLSSLSAARRRCWRAGRYRSSGGLQGEPARARTTTSPRPLARSLTRLGRCARVTTISTTP
eukprot:5157486-Prymnesium_polylepis.1